MKLDRAEDARPLAEALCAGGLPVAEVTFRTDAAEESIRIMRKGISRRCLSGQERLRILTRLRARWKREPQFIVSPGMSRAVVEYALEKGLAVFPGTCTPTEVMMAMEYQLPVVKFFPAKQYGGL